MAESACFVDFSLVLRHMVEVGMMEVHVAQDTGHDGFQGLSEAFMELGLLYHYLRYPIQSTRKRWHDKAVNSGLLMKLLPK